MTRDVDQASEGTVNRGSELPETRRRWRETEATRRLRKPAVDPCSRDRSADRPAIGEGRRPGQSGGADRGLGVISLTYRGDPEDSTRDQSPGGCDSFLPPSFVLARSYFYPLHCIPSTVSSLLLRIP